MDLTVDGQQLVDRIRNRTARIGIVGLGYVGLPLAATVAQAGFKTIGFDIDGDLAKRLRRVAMKEHAPLAAEAEHLLEILPVALALGHEEVERQEHRVEVEAGEAPLVHGRDPSEHVFLNRCGRPITRFGIHTLVKRCAARAVKDVPSLATKRVSPHTIRHTTATHLLRSGVDINTIRAWLGHVSLTTTNIYAEVDLEMKAKALAGCEVSDPQAGKPWREDEGLMAFLDNL